MIGFSTCFLSFSKISPPFLFMFETFKVPRTAHLYFERSHRITTLNWIYFSILEEYHIFGNERQSTVPTQAMTRANTVDLDINQLNVSVCCVYSRISRREILFSPIILPTFARFDFSTRTFVKLVRKTSI